MSRKGFTLLELLIIIVIVTVLAIVVVLTLNPPELLKQARDGNRVSDMTSLSNAIGQVLAISPYTSLGSTTTVYLSIPDPTATTTAGTDCTGVGLGGLSYHCPASSTYKNTDGTGWIPVNLSMASSSLASLPTDPINSASSGNIYYYATDGSCFEVVALPESKKESAMTAKFVNGSCATGIIAIGKRYALTRSVVAWTVPSGISSVQLVAAGAGGGKQLSGSTGLGNGGLAGGTLAVTPGQTYYYSVGGGGGATGGYGGGGSGADGGGGGMTWFSTVNTFNTSTVLLVAGGGGGFESGFGTLGRGGGTTGETGGGTSGYRGVGGTQTAGGGGYPAGSAGQGGAGMGGGGGGGYYGGGSGDDDGCCGSAGGGGGSSYISSLLTATSTTLGGGSAGSATTGADGYMYIATY